MTLAQAENRWPLWHLPYQSSHSLDSPKYAHVNDVSCGVEEVLHSRLCGIPRETISSAVYRTR